MTSAVSLSSSETDFLVVTPKSARRKPIPTPRNTLNRPQKPPRKISIDLDSQGQTSIESRSSTDESEKIIVNGDDDILAALEKIPGVGSLRSIQSIGSSMPSLHARVKREDSSHSLGSHASPLQQFSDRSVDADLVRDAVHRKHSLRLLDQRVRQRNGGGPLFANRSHVSPLNSPGAGSTSPTSPGKTSLTTSEERHVTETIPETPEDEEPRAEKMEMIQARPLPDLPKSGSSHSKEEEEQIEVVSTEEIYTQLLSPSSTDHYCELNPKQPAPSLADCSRPSTRLISSNGYLTLSGTVKRGRLKEEKNLDITLTMTPDHLSKLEKQVHDKHHDRCFCGLNRGPHVFFLSLLCLPFYLIYGTLQAFFLGTLTWYNIFIYYNEERSCCHKLISPFILLVYPLWIIPITLGLGLYKPIAQVSWYWESWLKEVRDPDSGFLGWVCNKLDVPDCAPYQTVLLSAKDYETPPKGAIPI